MWHPLNLPAVVPSPPQGHAAARLPGHMSAAGLGYSRRVQAWTKGEILRRVPLWTMLAVGVGNLASLVSRVLKVGSGAMIGGRVTLRLSPNALRHLCAHRQVVLVTGTNGKTTTTRMVSAALARKGPVASNDTGANMPDGLVAALSHHLSAPYAALEIDERYFARIAPTLRPAAAVLLNLSRDQLDRFGEVRELERAVRAGVEQLGDTSVIANAKDVLVASAAMAAPRHTWVSAVAASWLSDGNVCPRCGAYIDSNEGAEPWKCVCGLAEPEPDWLLEGSELRDPAGARTRIELGLPGDINMTNAAMAIAAAETVGVAPDAAADAIQGVADVRGRYQTVRRGGRTVRLLLAKNPAGWAETLSIVGGAEHTILVAINGREADGRDLSWLWDVPFEKLRGAAVLASGECVDDLSVRLTYAEVAHTAVADPIEAIDSIDTAAGTGVELISNYTAFNGIRRRLGID